MADQPNHGPTVDRDSVGNHRLALALFWHHDTQNAVRLRTAQALPKEWAGLGFQIEMLEKCSE